MNIDVHDSMTSLVLDDICYVLEKVSDLGPIAFPPYVFFGLLGAFIFGFWERAQAWQENMGARIMRHVLGAQYCHYYVYDNDSTKEMILGHSFM